MVDRSVTAIKVDPVTSPTQRPSLQTARLRRKNSRFLQGPRQKPVGRGDFTPAAALVGLRLLN
jgi:hypothetical protein